MRGAGEKKPAHFISKRDFFLLIFLKESRRGGQVYPPRLCHVVSRTRFLTQWYK